MTPATPERTQAGGSPMARLARVLGCTEGQAYTAVVGMILTLTAALLGLPPTLRDRVAATGSLRGGQTAPPPPLVAQPVEPPPPSGGPLGTLPDDVAAPKIPTAEPPPVAPLPPAVNAVRGFGGARVLARVADPGAPDGLAVDAAGRVYVATNNALVRGGSGASELQRYGPNGRLEKELPVTGQPPARTAGLTGVLVSSDGLVLALDGSRGRVLRLDLERRRQATYATLDDLPPCGPNAPEPCEPGADDDPQPRALARDGDGGFYVTDVGQGVVWHVPEGGNAEPWFVFGEGDAVAGPTGVAIDGRGNLIVASAVAGGENAPGGLVERIEVRADGRPGRRTTLATTDPLSGPIGVAAVPGAIVVALAGSNALLLLDQAGVERARLTAEQVTAQAGTPLDGPTGLALHDGSILVTNQSPIANDASRWVVFEVILTT